MTVPRLVLVGFLSLLPVLAAAQPQSAAEQLFDPHQSPLPHFKAKAAKPRKGSRVGFEMNPAPFAREYLKQPALAPTEPRDGPFDARGDLQYDGPNATAFWRANNDLDLSASYRLNHRTGLMMGFSPSARGRFTPVETGTPKVIFFQLTRRW